MRDEIMKKRLDNVLLKGTNARLTQPGHLAMVYSQPQEALESRGSIEYLHASGSLTEGVEEVELEEMHGADAAQWERLASVHSIAVSCCGPVLKQGCDLTPEAG